MNHEVYAASVDEITQGYKAEANGERLVCLFCGHVVEEGVVYGSPGQFVTGKRAMNLHVSQAHGSVFETLIGQGKHVTSLTQAQREMMLAFYQGLSDKEISQRTGVSGATVRFQRHSLREKAKQAKVFLALAQLMESGLQENAPVILPIHEGATMVDERYMTTPEEAEKVIRTYFESVKPYKLNALPPKNKKKLVILRVVAGEFEKGKTYTEKEVNTVLREIYTDVESLRRSLIEYGFMDRVRDGSQYWLKD